jgi:hypothetical protein
VLAASLPRCFLVASSLLPVAITHAVVLRLVSYSLLVACRSDLLSPALSLTCCHSRWHLDHITVGHPLNLSAAGPISSCYSSSLIGCLVQNCNVRAKFSLNLQLRGQTWTVFAFRAKLLQTSHGIRISSALPMESKS